MLDAAGLRVLVQAGLAAPVRPDRLIGMALALARWGVSPAAGCAVAAARHPYRLALVDDNGELTWRDLDRRTDRIAGELRARGLREGEAVGLLARNGRGAVESAVALSRVGAHVLYLNTGDAAGPLAQVLDDEQAAAVVYDEEFADLLAGARAGRLAFTTEQLAELAVRSTLGPPPKPATTSRQVILISGTTGAPRGAARGGAGSEVGSTVVPHRTFDPHMLERLVGAAATASYDVSSLRILASSGGALTVDLVQRGHDVFGPVLYNLPRNAPGKVLRQELRASDRIVGQST